MWLTMLAANVRLANWYDWIEDCDDPNNRECRFGVVHPDASPKPAFVAAHTLLTLLGQSQLDFNGHWPAGNGTVLSFDEQSKFAVWLNVNTNYTAPIYETVTFKGKSNTCYEAHTLLGDSVVQVCADGQGLMRVNASGTPTVLAS
jgi:hypothetical protein